MHQSDGIYNVQGIMTYIHTYEHSKAAQQASIRGFHHSGMQALKQSGTQSQQTVATYKHNKQAQQPSKASTASRITYACTQKHAQVFVGFKVSVELAGPCIEHAIGYLHAARVSDECALVVHIALPFLTSQTKHGWPTQVADTAFKLNVRVDKLTGETHKLVISIQHAIL